MLAQLVCGVSFRIQLHMYMYKYNMYQSFCVSIKELPNLMAALRPRVQHKYMSSQRNAQKNKNIMYYVVLVLADGYTYERNAIASWMKSGKKNSPMTNSPLQNNSLTPNRSLKILIQKYVQHKHKS